MGAPPSGGGGGPAPLLYAPDAEPLVLKDVNKYLRTFVLFLYAGSYAPYAIHASTERTILYPKP